MSNLIDLGNVSIDRDRFEVWVAGERVDLTFVEFELLSYLASNAGKVVTRQDLLLAIWSESDQARDRKLTVHVSRLRKKIGGSRPWRIETVTKRGYVLTDPSQRKQASSSNGGTGSGLRIVKTEENR